MENKKEIKRPIWCDYPDDVTHPLFGCWSLTKVWWRVAKNGNVDEITEDYCKDCECFLEIFSNDDID